ncbi:MAG TPA: 16S rRNA (cytidine(1402)-2'-O)-methyltransferase [Gemmatimonadaceae bacterium]|nr:16S rRNA (cytidine(1402)-2'-O)-methyltransferase [Gemmatimonadaceae bacterium]
MVDGRLYVVSTPIGNLADLTFRAVDVLKTVDRILCEDTRHTRILLDHYAIRTPTSAYHEHNEAKATPGIVAELAKGATFALVTDAGTPILSDPGARLVRAAIAAGVPVEPVPGASALLAAVVAAGLDADRFTFYGFLPRKGAERRALLGQMATAEHLTILYEAPGRVAATLAEIGGKRQAVVARELTKQFEELRRGTVEELAAYYEEHPPRGEVVVLIEGVVASPPDEMIARSRSEALRTQGRSAREIMQSLMTELQLPRNVAYRLAHEEEQEDERQ